MAKKFFICKHCGNIVGMIKDSGVNIKCCGENMEELVPGVVDASTEKHIPVITVDGNTVKVVVGTIIHPMQPDHKIEWIYLQTNQGGQRKCLCKKESPEAVFALAEGEEPVAVYAYCDLHGLWKADI